MAIDSLNNLLKTNHFKRNHNLTIHKLLDVVEELVDIKICTQNGRENIGHVHNK